MFRLIHLDPALTMAMAFLARRPDGCFRNSGLAHDRHDAMAIGAHEHNPRALGDLLSRVPVGEQTLKFGAPLALEHDLRLLLPHPASESYSRRRWIQMFVTEH